MVTPGCSFWRLTSLGDRFPVDEAVGESLSANSLAQGAPSPLTRLRKETALSSFPRGTHCWPEGCPTVGNTSP